MADNRNMKLSDADLAQASGGVTLGDHGMPTYDAYGKVLRFLGDQQYLVVLDDGAEVTATFDQRHIVEDGTSVGLTATGGGWSMEEANPDLDY